MKHLRDSGRLPHTAYYRDDYFGVSRPRKVLVFSGWRFVPKTVAIVASRVAAGRLGGDSEEASQPLRFTEKWSFHVFDVCFPSLFLAKVGHEAFMAARKAERPRAEDVVRDGGANPSASTSRNRGRGGVRRRTPRLAGRDATGADTGASPEHILDALNECVEDQEEGSGRTPFAACGTGGGVAAAQPDASADFRESA